MEKTRGCPSPEAILALPRSAGCLHRVDQPKGWVCGCKRHVDQANGLPVASRLIPTWGAIWVEIEYHWWWPFEVLVVTIDGVRLSVGRKMVGKRVDCLQVPQHRRQQSRPWRWMVLVPNHRSQLGEAVRVVGFAGGYSPAPKNGPNGWPQWQKPTSKTSSLVAIVGTNG